VRVGVDVGGTFTDLVALGADGTLEVRKVTTTPDDPTVGMFRAVDLLGTREARKDSLTVAGGGTRDSVIDLLVHGTTIATNALLERRGARVVLVTTLGFEDLLWLRRQERASLYDLARDHPPPLVARDHVVGVAERMGPGGALEPLAEREVERVVGAVRALAPEAVTVAFLFAFRHPEHERRVAAALRGALPGIPVTASHEVLPAFREYERISTATVEAYLRPRVSAYLARLEAPVRERRIGGLRIMTSSGGSLAPAAAARRAASLALSGPAGGVVGARLVGAAVGVSDLLAIDMGGTSADASLVTAAEALTEGTGAVAGIPLALPSILIETVSAGGGSVAWVDEGGALKVGPESAGAVPGPACYGRGGDRPTVTDACLVLGWLDAASPLADELRLDPALAERAVASLGSAVGREPHAIAAGIVAVAAATMARALKRVSVARGFDPRQLALLPYGGAGPLFGCALADALGMRTIVLPPHPGVLSALGLAAAAERIEVMASFHRALPALTTRELAAAFAPLVERAREELPGAALARAADCRFAGQGYEVTIPAPLDDPAPLAVAFLATHRARYGHEGGGQPIELVNLRVAAVKSGGGSLPQLDGRAREQRAPRARRTATVGGARVEASVWPLGELAAGVELEGPAILAGGDATALVEPGWRGRVHRSGAILLERR